MKNIKIETNWVRVIGNTRNPTNQEMNQIVGAERGVKTSHYEGDTICVWNENKSDWWTFNKADVRFLTPAMFKGVHIAIGDEVLVDEKWRKVIGFYPYDNETKLLTGTLNDTIDWSESSIKDHRTETPTETKMTIAQIEEKLNITGLVITE